MIEHDPNRQAHSTQSGPSASPAGEIELHRRAFVQLMGAGLLITVMEQGSYGQRRRSRGAQKSLPGYKSIRMAPSA